MYQWFYVHLSCIVVNYFIEKEEGNVLIGLWFIQLVLLTYVSGCNWRCCLRCSRFFCGLFVYLLDDISCGAHVCCPTYWSVVGFILYHVWVFWAVVSFFLLPYFFSVLLHSVLSIVLNYVWPHLLSSWNVWWGHPLSFLIIGIWSIFRCWVDDVRHLLQTIEIGKMCVC